MTAETHEGVRPPELELQGLRTTGCGCWELNSGHLDEALHALNFGAISPDQHLLLKRFISNILTSKSTKFHKIC